MNIHLVLELLKGIGIAIGIGTGFFVIPFGLIILSRMLPWFIWGWAFKRNIIRNSSKSPDYPFNNSRYNKQIYVDYCHPSQVIKRFKNDGLQSLFRDYYPTKTPVQQPDTLCNKNTPVNFLKSANPKPIDNKLNNCLDNPFHADNLAQGKDDVNHKQTEPYLLISIFN